MGFSGNVVNLLQGIVPLYSILPRLLTDTGIINIRSRRGNNPSVYKDFKVRRDHILHVARNEQSHSNILCGI